MSSAGEIIAPEDKSHSVKDPKILKTFRINFFTALLLWKILDYIYNKQFTWHNHLDELGFQNDSDKRNFVSSFNSKVEIVELLVMSLLGTWQSFFLHYCESFLSNARTSLTKPSEWCNIGRLNLKYISILKFLGCKLWFFATCCAIMPPTVSQIASEVDLIITFSQRFWNGKCFSVVDFAHSS